MDPHTLVKLMSVFIKKMLFDYIYSNPEIEFENEESRNFDLI